MHDVDDGMRTVVGIVGDIRHLGPEGSRRQEAYVPFTGNSASLVIRTAGDPMTTLPAVKRAVWSVDRDQIVPDDNVTLESHLDALVAQRRFSVALLALLGVLALVIAAAGVYGVMAYVVSQRTQEIGVRMALGARPADVVSMVMGRASLLVAAGLAIGCALAWYVSTGVQSFLFLIASNDWRVFAASAVVLGLTGMAACALPARRAAHVDPLIALRGD
jgi:ABC-type antimicrobial peptide transport system permease subunit